MPKGKKIESEECNFFRIGQLSKLTGISVHTLRYYDKIGFINPEYIDLRNQYRYYSSEQFYILKVIQQLKFLGFSLKDVKKFFTTENYEEIENLFVVKLKEAENKINQYNNVLDHINNSINILNQEVNIYPHFKYKDFRHLKIKKFCERNVVFVRKKRTMLFKDRLKHFIELQNIIWHNNYQFKAPFILNFFDDIDSFLDINLEYDIEMSVEVKEKISENHYSKVISESEYITGIIKGNFEKGKELIISMKEWANQNNYVLLSPISFYYILPQSITKSKENTIYEIQIPIKSK